MYGPAASALKRADEISPDAPIIVAFLAAVYAATGHPDFDETMDRLNTISNRRYVSPFLMGWIYSVLDHRKALEWLERGYAQRAEWMALLKTGSVFDPMRSEPGFQALFRRVNFPQIG
jgi:hypothetical protein